MKTAEVDSVVNALARQDVGSAIRLLETQSAQRLTNRDDIFMLAYLYCLSGNVQKAEALAAANARSIPKDSYVDWVWEKLRSEFGFRPPS